MRRFCLVTSLLFILYSGSAQFEDYTDSTGIYLSSMSAMFGNGLSAFDFNQDNFDDLTVAENNTGIALYASNGDGSFDLENYLPLEADIKQVLWVDFDNDSDADLFASTNGDGLYLFERLASGQLFPREDLFQEYQNLFAYGASWGDYNKDGWKDLFVCVYNYWGESEFPNLLFRNDGGVFTEVGADLGVASWSNNAFQSVWTDFDNDTWPDLYVINDHSVGNEYYRNLGGEGFENLSSINGAGVAQSSMCNSLSDYDRDGDFDIFVSDGGYQTLLQNNNGSFINVADVMNVNVLTFGWAGLWIDYNKDGWEDLHLATDESQLNQNWNYFFVNNEAGGFTEEYFDNYSYSSFCSVKGDFNNDRLPDFAVYNGFPAAINLWLNKHVPDDHTVKLRLEGQVSDRFGVGTEVIASFGGYTSRYQILSGENYIGQNASDLLIGCGEVSVIDSLIVEWPSGWIDRYYDLPADSTYVLSEGETLEWSLISETDFMLCNGEEIQVSIASEVSFAEIVWSNDMVGEEVVFSEAGEYSVELITENGVFATQTFSIDLFPTPDITVQTMPASCPDLANGSVVLTSADLAAINGTAFTGSMEIANLSAGNHTFLLEDMNGCYTEFSTEILAPEPIAVETSEVLLCPGVEDFPAILPVGGSPPYTIESSFQGGILNAGIYPILVTDAQGCSLAFDLSVEFYDPVDLAVITDTLCPGETGTWSLLADDSTILSAAVEGVEGEELSAGAYILDVLDVHGCQSFHPFEVLSFPDYEWDYELVLDEEGDAGQIHFIGESDVYAAGYLWSDGSSLDYLVFSEPGFYSCQITDIHGCQSEIVIDLEYLSMNKPADGNAQAVLSLAGSEIRTCLNSPETLFICDMAGKVVRTHSLPSGTSMISLEGLSGAIYIAGIAGRSLVFPLR